jgi:hypothetical protein
MDDISHNETRRLPWTVAGLVFGVVMVIFALSSLRWGRGSAKLLGVVSSPISICDNLLLAIFAPLVLWPMVGLLLSLSRDKWYMIPLCVVMLAHFAGQLVIAQHGLFADWDWVNRSTYVGFAAYGIGQLVIVLKIIDSFRSRKPVEGHCAECNYELRGLEPNGSGRCPECGTSWRDAA